MESKKVYEKRNCGNIEKGSTLFPTSRLWNALIVNCKSRDVFIFFGIRYYLDDAFSSHSIVHRSNASAFLVFRIFLFFLAHAFCSQNLILVSNCLK